jgi:hypothetical protein
VGKVKKKKQNQNEKSPAVSDAPTMPQLKIEPPKGCVILNDVRVVISHVQTWQSDGEGASIVGLMGGRVIPVDMPIKKLDERIIEAMRHLQ